MDTKTTGKPIRFKRLAKGLYCNHAWGMTISHEAVWNKVDGRKWEATWKITSYGMSTFDASRKFDTLAEARAFLLGLVAKATR